MLRRNPDINPFLALLKRSRSFATVLNANNHNSYINAVRTNSFSLKPTTSLEKNTYPENYDNHVNKIPHEKTEQPHDDADNRFHEEHA